ncbi:hypothetical protein J2Z40_000888 [Cytobacillus eiseniae]|uniref:NERD domain-containing protein n=1 Tax=Cytobacillus eiseniae TaxID=762947 RepID=A0ABS4RBR2_9BACI|nr:nuclease-related domain-containing protein [Cytobacillus eiseniae]MBP2240333.1 hypothetical protein [Cytobacillus eiseniae]
MVKKFIKHSSIYKLEALLRRLRMDHPKYEEIKEDFRKKLAGYTGERAISYYLDFLPDKDVYIFHHLRLPSGKHYFQIDYLVLSRRLAFILECKNFYGTLFLEDSFQQLIRTTNEKEEGFQNPLSQAKWHQQQLHVFLQNHGYSQLPIEYLVAFSNPSTILKSNSRNQSILKRVVHGYNLLERMKSFEKAHQNEVIDIKGVRKLSNLLMKNHKPEEMNILKKYGLSKTDILTGVQCLNCHKLGMIRFNRRWLCEKCGCFDRLAHVEAVKDYFLLMNSTMTNQQFREFVHLSSIDMASKLLIRMNLPHSGTNKGRVYYPPTEFN